MNQNIDQFLLRRPYYSRAHVEEIASHCEGVVPFCGECRDWHYPNELHTEDCGETPSGVQPAWAAGC